MSKIFVSYRRDDASSEADAISTALRGELGEDAVFLDTSSIPPGAEWPKTVRTAVEAARLVLAVIGPDWLRAGSDEWGRRRIDRDDDWVRREVALALSLEKTVVPVLVRGGRMPPSDVLPADLAALPKRQAIELRRDYWHHDIKLLIGLVQPGADGWTPDGGDRGPYPRDVPIGPDPFSDDKIEEILESDLSNWTKRVSPLPEDPAKVRIELFREYKFKTFQEAIRFMSQLAPGCDIANHHPRWENLWKTLRVSLTTWDIGHRISDRDVQLARYFDKAYSEFPGAATARDG